MGNDRTEELLLQLIQDMAEVKAKLNNIDEQKLSSRVDWLEAQAREQDRVIKTLENREAILEEFIRNNMNEANKSNKAVWTSIGIAFLTAALSFLIIYNRRDIMKLDIKARLRNKYFWVSMLSLVVLLLDQLGIKLPVDINEIGGTILSIAVLLGIIVDNGSEGFSDKHE